MNSPVLNLTYAVQLAGI